MRKDFVIGLLIVADLLGGTLAFADESSAIDYTECTVVAGILVCKGSSRVDRPSSGSSSAYKNDASPEDLVRFAPYEQILPNGPNGKECTMSGYREVPPGVDPSVVSAFRERDTRDIFATYLPCPAQPGSTETRQSVAVHYWRDIPLPEPNPWIAPGRAITGKFAYLETRATTSHTFHAGRHAVWAFADRCYRQVLRRLGDGTTTGPHPDEGGPWPNGRITHEYLRIGKYDVVVTERWTATWQFGAESGTLTELRTTGRIDDFPVEQIQVIRYR